MKLFGRILLFAILLLIISPVLLLGYFGFVPGLSDVFGSDKPRNLKVNYSKADFDSGHKKSGVEYMSLPPSTPDEKSIQRSGSHSVSMELSSAEATALMNNRPWRNWPYSNVQVKFNGDGSAEVSGILLKDRVPGYAAAIGIPKQAVAFAMKFLPVNPVFYLKMKASLSDNRVSVFEPQKFEIGRVPLPIPLFLSLSAPKIPGKVYAVDIAGMAGELSKIRNKKDLIISFINGRISGYSDFFFAKRAYFGEDKLFFEGRLADREATAD